MKLKAMKTISVKEYDVSKSFDSVQEHLNQLSGNSFLVGNLISTTVGTGDTAIPHGLAATPNGYLILDLTANATVWRVSWDSRVITLKASASAPIKLWVF